MRTVVGSIVVFVLFAVPQRDVFGTGLMSPSASTLWTNPVPRNPVVPIPVLHVDHQDLFERLINRGEAPWLVMAESSTSQGTAQEYELAPVPGPWWPVPIRWGDVAVYYTPTELLPAGAVFDRIRWSDQTIPVEPALFVGETAAYEAPEGLPPMSLFTTLPAPFSCYRPTSMDHSSIDLGANVDPSVRFHIIGPGTDGKPVILSWFLAPELVGGSERPRYLLGGGWPESIRNQLSIAPVDQAGNVGIPTRLTPASAPIWRRYGFEYTLVWSALAVTLFGLIAFAGRRFRKRIA